MSKLKRRRKSRAIRVLLQSKVEIDGIRRYIGLINAADDASRHRRNHAYIDGSGYR